MFLSVMLLDSFILAEFETLKDKQNIEYYENAVVLEVSSLQEIIQ